MCSNTGDKSLFFRDTEELLRRARFLRDTGFRRVVVTGGEATIHPGFWTVIEWLSANGITWDINSHGRSFSTPGFAERAVGNGLQRAIVSLHSFDAPTSAAIFGVSEEAHEGSVAGIRALVEAGVHVMLNCVISRLNLDQLEDYLETGLTLFGSDVEFKFVFPSTIGKGGEWSEIAELRYSDVRDRVVGVKSLASRLACEDRLRVVSELRTSRSGHREFRAVDVRGVSLPRRRHGRSCVLDASYRSRAVGVRRGVPRVYRAASLFRSRAAFMRDDSGRVSCIRFSLR